MHRTRTAGLALVATPMGSLPSTGLSDALPVIALVLLGAAAIGLAIRRRRGE